MGLIDKIKNAKSVKEVTDLVAEAHGYNMASNQTKRRIVRKAHKRFAELKEEK